MMMKTDRLYMGISLMLSLVFWGYSLVIVLNEEELCASPLDYIPWSTFIFLFLSIPLLYLVRISRLEQRGGRLPRSLFSIMTFFYAIYYTLLWVNSSIGTICGCYCTRGMVTGYALNMAFDIGLKAFLLIILASGSFDPKEIVELEGEQPPQPQ